MFRQLNEEKMVILYIKIKHLYIYTYIHTYIILTIDRKYHNTHAKYY